MGVDEVEQAMWVLLRYMRANGVAVKSLRDGSQALKVELHELDPAVLRRPAFQAEARRKAVLK